MTAEASTCDYCGKEGHQARRCWQKRDDARTDDKKPKNKQASGGNTGAKGAAGQNGASDHFVDDKFIPGLRQGMTEYQTLDQPKPIEIAGNMKVFATATGKICRHIINQSGQPIPVRISVMILPGMGRHIFSSARAMRSGVSTILETGNPHNQLDSKTSLTSNQHQNAGMCSFDVSLRALDGVTNGRTKTPSTPSVALSAQASADTWHRRLGYMNPRNMELLRKVGGNGVEYTGTVSGCDICAVGK
ncbi:unnamed protein product, partial [Scytosiphon promiscuus]